MLWPREYSLCLTPYSTRYLHALCRRFQPRLASRYGQPTLIHISFYDERLLSTKIVTLLVRRVSLKVNAFLGRAENLPCSSFWPRVLGAVLRYLIPTFQVRCMYNTALYVRDSVREVS